MRTSALRALAAALLALALAAGATPPFPARGIAIVVPEAPGGESDGLARILAPALAEVWGQPVTVENVTGEGRESAAWRVSRASWDAYTLLLAPSATIEDPRVHYFAAVTLVASSPLVVVAGAKSRLAGVADLVKAAGARPGKLAYAAVGSHRARGLAGEHFKAVAKVDLRRVEHATAQEALAAVAAGKADVAFVPLREALAAVAAGKAKALAVTGAARAHALPKVPTVAESGFERFVAVEWQGLMLPSATPRPLVAAHNDGANKALALPGVREKIRALGLEPEGGPLMRLVDLIRMDREEWLKLAVPKDGKP